jgi:hypothetical protein
MREKKTINSVFKKHNIQTTFLKLTTMVCFSLFVNIGFAQHTESNTFKTASPEKSSSINKQEETKISKSTRELDQPVNQVTTLSKDRATIEQEVYAKIPLDRLSPDVLDKIETNKHNRLSILSGINKAFILEIAGVNSPETCSSQLASLSKYPWILKTIHVSGNRVMIQVDITKESLDLKSALQADNISANFIEQTLVIN